MTQPDEQRTPSDLLLLVQAALAANLPQEALTLTLDPRLAPGGKTSYECDRFKLTALLQLGDFANATDVALRNGDRTPVEIDTLVGLLQRKNQRETADQLCSEALSQQRTPAEQADLLLTRSRLHSGLPRWRHWLAAVKSLNDGRKAGELNQLVADIFKESDATTLIEETTDPAARRALRMRQVELTSDSRLAAGRVAELLADNAIPEDRVAWASSLLFNGGRQVRLVHYLEDRLRHGKTLSAELRELLRLSYQALGRNHDADRAVLPTRTSVPSVSSVPLVLHRNCVVLQCPFLHISNSRRAHAVDNQQRIIE